MRRARVAGVFVFVTMTQVGAPSGATTLAVPLTELSGPKLEQCERSGLLRPACPRLVPRVPGYLSGLAVEQAGERAALDVFNLERGGEFPKSPERNRPPAMAHVVAAAGDVELLTPFRDPRGATGVALRDGLLRRERVEPTSFGRVRWGRRSGTFYLAPAWPLGGMLGNHLVFSWGEHGRRYSLSLHAWEPLTETAATLRAMVLRLPAPAEAARLIRLSPVRRRAMPRGPGIARVDLSAPSSRRRALDVYAVASGRADIEIRIETSAGDRVPVIDSTRRCSLRIPLRICFVRVPGEIAPRGGRWTIVLTKRSSAPARVRVDLRFR